MNRNHFSWIIAVLVLLGIASVQLGSMSTESQPPVASTRTQPMYAGFSPPAMQDASSAAVTYDPALSEEEEDARQEPAFDEEDDEEEARERERREVSRMEAEEREAEEREAEERDRAADEELRDAERELERLEREIHQAMQRGERERVEQLRHAAERLEDELRREHERRQGELERRRDGEREEMDRERMEREQLEMREMELQRVQLGIERAEVESGFGRLETIMRLAQIASEEVTAATYAVMHVEQFMEIPEAVDFLNHMLKESENPAIRRVIRIHLMELNAQLDRREDAREQLQHLILSE